RVGGERRGDQPAHPAPDGRGRAGRDAAPGDRARSGYAQRLAAHRPPVRRPPAVSDDPARGAAHLPPLGRRPAAGRAVRRAAPRRPSGPARATPRVPTQTAETRLGLTERLRVSRSVGDPARILAALAVLALSWTATAAGTLADALRSRGLTPPREALPFLEHTVEGILDDVRDLLVVSAAGEGQSARLYVTRLRRGSRGGTTPPLGRS